MTYLRKNITLPADIDERLKQEHNASGTITEALRMYWDHKDLVKQVISKNREIISLLEEKKTTGVRYADEMSRLQAEHPDYIFRQTTNGVEVFHRGRREWHPVDEVDL